jgi:hypothetical protein
LEFSLVQYLPRNDENTEDDFVEEGVTLSLKYS